LDDRHHTYEVLQGNRELGERIQLALRPLELDSSAYIADLLIGPEPKRVPHGQLVLPWTLLTLVAVGSALAHLIPFWLCAVPLAINVIISIKISAQLGHNVDALLGLARMLGAAKRISAVRGAVKFSLLDRLVSEAQKREVLRSQIKSLAALETAQFSFVGGFAVAANLLFLLKLTLYVRSIDRFAGSRAEWLSTFQLIGAVDASIAVASFLCRYPKHCRPR
jgi:hypothetical protein